MRRHTSRLLVLATLVCVAACSNPITSRKPWDDYAGETLKVHDADRATAGQLVWRAVKEQESVRDFLRAQGEPDTLEIRGGRFSQKTIILYYTRRCAGAPHSIRLDPVKDGFVPRAPEPIVTVPRGNAIREPRAARPGTEGDQRGDHRGHERGDLPQRHRPSRAAGSPPAAAQPPLRRS